MNGAKNEKGNSSVSAVGNKKWHIGLGMGITALVVIGVIGMARHKKKIKIDLSRFDSPDQKGSGKCMDRELLKKLHQLAKVTRLPIFEMINSGARSSYWNTKVGGVSNSSHKIPICKAVDIKAPTTAIRNKIVLAAKQVGFKRIGVGKTFVHLDTDETKKQYVAWGYPSGRTPPINPFV